MTIDELRAALESANRHVQSVRNDPARLAHSLAVIVGDISAYPLETQALIEAVKQVEALRDSVQKFLMIPGISTTGGADGLSIWMLRRSLERGIDGVLQDLVKFATASAFSVRNVTTIEGLKLARRCSIDRDTYLVPWDDLEESTQKQRIRLAFVDQMRWPSAAVVRDFQIPKAFMDPSALPTSAFPDLPIDNASILNCAGLFGPVSPMVTGSWWEAPDWVPAMGLSYSLGFASFRALSSEWPEEAYDAFPALYAQFTGSSEEHRQHLRVPLERLNAAMLKSNPVDAAIDCRIAVESLFLTDQQGDRGELTFRICIRASRFLASDYGERKRIYDEIKDLYRAGSIAVHSGSISPLRKDQTVDELLSIGRRRIAQALKKLIADGPQDWKAIELM